MKTRTDQKRGPRGNQDWAHRRSPNDANVSTDTKVQ